MCDLYEKLIQLISKFERLKKSETFFHNKALLFFQKLILKKTTAKSFSRITWNFLLFIFFQTSQPKDFHLQNLFLCLYFVFKLLFHKQKFIVVVVQVAAVAVVVVADEVAGWLDLILAFERTVLNPKIQSEWTPEIKKTPWLYVINVFDRKLFYSIVKK